METFLTIASKRDQRAYASERVPDRVRERILEAGRVSGSARNRQQRRFVVLSSAARERAAGAVTRPSNLERCALAIAVIIGDGAWDGFDAGRAAQSMMLAAWSEGVGSCPNAIADAEALGELLGVVEPERVAVVLSFGFPPAPRDPASRSPAEWLERADRLPLDELVGEA